MGVLSRRDASAAVRSQTREKILGAARALGAQGRPFAELSVVDIAAGAGVSRPTFYTYFRDKRELVLTLGLELEHDIRQVTGPWLRGEDDDIRTVLKGMLACLQVHRAALAALVEAATYDAEVATFWRALHETFLTSAADRMVRDTGLSRADAEARAFAITWMTERSFAEHLSAPRVQERALLDALELLWGTALAAPAR